MTWIILWGCRAPGEPRVVLEPTCEPNAGITAVTDCTFPSPRAGVGSVEYWPAGQPELARSTPRGPEGEDHDVAVLGMKAGEAYELRAVVEAGERRYESEVLTVVAEPVPADFPVLTLDASDPARSQLANSHVLLAIASMQTSPTFTAIVILDGDGDYVWWTRTRDRGLGISPRVTRDGRGLQYLVSDMTWTEDLGNIRRVSFDGDELLDTTALLGHHASFENADGTLSWLSFVYETVDGVDWAADAIRTAPIGGGAPTMEFSWFDDYPEDPWEAVPGITDEVRYGEGLEWAHTNSLTAIDDDYFYVMSKNLDCLLKVERGSGALVWQMGGRYGEFRYPDGTNPWTSVSQNSLFSHAHMSQVTDGGVLVFDNGDYHTPKRTRAIEYAFDEEAKTVEEVWRYVEPDGGFTGSMGDVRRLANGNTAISWASLEHVDEVTPEGDLVWKVSMSGVGMMTRLTPILDLYHPTFEP